MSEKLDQLKENHNRITWMTDAEAVLEDHDDRIKKMEGHQLRQDITMASKQAMPQFFQADVDAARQEGFTEGRKQTTIYRSEINTAVKADRERIEVKASDASVSSGVGALFVTLATLKEIINNEADDDE